MIIAGGNMIYSAIILIEELMDHSKFQRMVREERYAKVVRGLYESDRNTTGYLLVKAIGSPSYLSLEYALSRHGFIKQHMP